MRQYFLNIYIPSVSLWLASLVTIWMVQIFGEAKVIIKIWFTQLG